MNVVDAVSFLWRMELQRLPASSPMGTVAAPGDVPLGNQKTRWQVARDAAVSCLGQHVWSFMDVHIAMALASAGDASGLESHLQSMAAFADGVNDPDARRGKQPEAASAGSGGSGTTAARTSGSVMDHLALQLQPGVAAGEVDTRLVTAAVGLETARGMVDFARGEYASAVNRLLATRPRWSWLGGSLAQRDVLEQTLLHAAIAAGQQHLARALASERATLRNASPQTWWLYGSVMEAMREEPRAADARNRAYVLGLGQRGPQY